MSTIAMGSAAAAVADFIRDQILQGELVPGAKIRQEDIASANGTSRVPVREALRVLESEGLVVLVPNRGASVAALDFDEFVELYRMREQLEPLLLSASVPALTEHALRASAALVDAIDQASDDLSSWIELDRQFHLSIYVESALPRAYRLVREFWNQTQPYRRNYVESLVPSDRALVNAEHRMILSSINMGDCDGAGDLLRGHIRRTRVSLAQHRTVFDS